MKTLNCKCCSAPLPPNLKCDYCGTQHEFDAVPMRIETYTAPIKEAVVKRAISAERMKFRGYDCLEFFAKTAAFEFAKNLKECIEIRREYNPNTNMYILRARMKAVVAENNILRWEKGKGEMTENELDGCI